ncbi:MAG: carbohydrate-binding domain-containing protein, partial [Lachnospiraceae bacterium]|nr:carbohydrate-binding domain-containing protein [Lachnospiraceae bacterium]
MSRLLSFREMRRPSNPAGMWSIVIVFHNSVSLDTSGAYHIILADGGKMSIVGDKDENDDWSAYSNGESPVGLGCLYDDDRKTGIDLSIYAQSAGTGELYINNGSGSFEDRIKVGDAINVDELTINGGKITCDTEGSKSYGISTKNLTINDGTVNATAATMNSYALFSTGNITINGGSITATANGTDGSGIKADASITINDGEVKAEALKGGTLDDNYGIRSDGQITINGGRVTAKGSKAGIYSGNDETPLLLSWEKETDYFSANSFSLPNADVAIRPGKTFTDGKGHYYVAANASEVKSLENVTLSATSDTVHAVNFDCGGYETVPPLQILKAGSTVTEPADPNGETTYDGKTFAGWYQDEAYQIRYDFDSELTADLYLHAKWASLSNDLENASVKMIYRYTGDTIEPVVENNIGNTLTKDTDYTVSCKKDGSDTAVSMKDPGFYNITVTGKNTYSGSKTVRVCVLTFDAYDPVSGELKHGVTLPEGKDAAIVTASTVSMNTGWYVVTENVRVDSRMKVNGDVHLVLCDGVTLDAGGDAGNRGISVTEGNSLTIYSQEGNSGKLDASTGKVNYYAAIGGDCPANHSNNSNNNINNNNGNFSFVTADFWLYAKWTIKQHSVSFNMAGKSVENMPETQTVEHGAVATRPA